MECPVCGEPLPADQALANDHVNSCLDHTTPALPTRQGSLCSFLSLGKTPPKPSMSSEGQAMPHLLRRLPRASNGGALKAQKRVLGTSFFIDAFSEGPIQECTFYFLSHFHSDHYAGLEAGFDWGTIVTSQVTGNLLSTVLHVDEARIRRLPLHEWTLIEPGAKVLLIDARHCPGSVMFVFRLTPEGSTAPPRYILHTGDFRASPELIEDPIWTQLGIPRFDAVYLDTTYCDPGYDFPPQSAAIASCLQTMHRLLNKADRRSFAPLRRLVLVGSYLIGKEKIALAAAELLDSKIYCSPRKRAVFACLQWPELQGRLAEEAADAQVHIVSMSDLDPRSIGVMLDQLWPRYTHALAIRPTGWTFVRPSRGGGTPSGQSNGLAFHDHLRKDRLNQSLRRRDAIASLAVPYSEHCSFSELVGFLAAPWMRFDWIIPTVDNPLDLYLRSSDFDNHPRELLTAWAARLRRSPQT